MKKLLIVIAILMLAIPASADPVYTEMVEMHLTGPNPFPGGTGEIIVTIDTLPGRRSRGAIGEPDSAGISESYFRIFMHVEIPGVGSYVLETGTGGVKMVSDIPGIPPPEGQEYVNENDVQKLLDSDDLVQQAIGWMLEAKHYAAGLVDNVQWPDGRDASVFGYSPALAGDTAATFRIKLDGYPDTLDILLTGTGSSYTIAYGVIAVPTSTPYGIIVLTLLLIATGAYLVYRRRNAATI